jgi:hypothetical protein
MGDEQQEFDIPALRARLLAFLGPDGGAYPTHLEQKFPRILDRIVALWGKAGLDAFLQELTVTQRPDRQGFPEDVAVELFRLFALHRALGLTPDRSLGTGWNWIEDAELFKREFTKDDE